MEEDGLIKQLTDALDSLKRNDVRYFVENLRRELQPLTAVTDGGLEEQFDIFVKYMRRYKL